MTASLASTSSTIMAPRSNKRGLCVNSTSIGSRGRLICKAGSWARPTGSSSLIRATTSTRPSAPCGFASRPTRANRSSRTPRRSHCRVRPRSRGRDRTGVSARQVGEETPAAAGRPAVEYPNPRYRAKAFQQRSADGGDATASRSSFTPHSIHPAPIQRASHRKRRASVPSSKRRGPQTRRRLAHLRTRRPLRRIRLATPPDDRLRQLSGLPAGLSSRLP